jgi:hypothetical protein
MRPLPLALSDWLYRALMQVYPGGFRKRFAAEMAQVFRTLCYDAYTESGVGGVMRLWLPAVRDWAWSAIYQWWMRLFTRKVGNMQTKLIDRRDGILPLSSAQAGLAALPFLAFGISSIVSKLEFFHTYPASLPLWQILLIHPYLVFNWLILIGLGAGILVGFPRWAYSFLGWALLFGWWWSDMGFYGYHLDWKIWLPMLGVILAALLIRRSWLPLRALFSGLWGDWTLLALGAYILYGHVYMLSDENHNPHLFIFIATSSIACSLGAWGYFHSASPLRRVLSLVGGLFLAMIIDSINYATWDYRAYYGLPESSQNVSLVGQIFIVCLTLLMLGIGLLALWRYARNSKLKEY